MTKKKKIWIAVAIVVAIVLIAGAILITVYCINHNKDNGVGGNGGNSGIGGNGGNEYVNPYYSGTYYDNINDKLTGAAFRSELASLITDTHTYNPTYDDLKEVYRTTDVDPEQNGNVIWFYTGNSVPYTGDMDKGDYPTNREHVWPKMGGNAFPEKYDTGSDAHHVRPLNTRLNNTRGNYQFGEVAKTTGNRVLQNGTYSDYGTDDVDTWCYLSGGAFYPAKGYRGATARILFYVQTRWGDDYSLSFVLGQGNTKTMGDVATLLKWHLEEPPTQEEIRRNEAVFGVQGNRNPFIDHPEYAELIYCNDGQSYNSQLRQTVENCGSYFNRNTPLASNASERFPSIISISAVIPTADYSINRLNKQYFE